jgi:hypothetical protein
MSRSILRTGAAIALLLAPAAVAYADDPTGELLQQRGLAPRYPGPGPLPAYIEGGVCFQGMHSEPSVFSGYRCVPNQPAQ